MPSYTYTSNIPASTDIPSQSQGQMQTNCNSIASIVNVDLYGFGNPNGGYHQKATLIEQSPVPSALADAAILYSADDGTGRTEVYLKRDTPPLTFALTFIKAWGRFAGATGVLTSSYNCSVARNAAGAYTVTFTNGVLNSNYGVVVTTQMTSSFTSGSIVGVDNLGTANFNIYSRSLTAASGVDPGIVSFIAFG